MYSKKTIEHFRNPEFAGKLENFDAVGEAGNIKCGDIMKIFLKVENDFIKDIRFLTYGCIAAIASSDVMCKLVKGKSISEALKLTSKDIVKELGELPPIKVHCSVLGAEALKKAIENYREKRK